MSGTSSSRSDPNPMDFSISYKDNLFGGFLDYAIRSRDSLVAKHPRNYTVVKVSVAVGMSVIAIPLAVAALIEGVARYALGVFIWIAAKVTRSITIQGFYDKCFSKSISSSYIAFFTSFKMMVCVWRLSNPVHNSNHFPVIGAGVNLVGLLSNMFQNGGTGTLAVFTEGRDILAKTRMSTKFKVLINLAIVTASIPVFLVTLVEGVIRIAASIFLFTVAFVTRSNSVSDINKRYFSEALPATVRGIIKFVKLVFLGFRVNTPIGHPEKAPMETVARITLALLTGNQDALKAEIQAIQAMKPAAVKSMLVKLLAKLEIALPTVANYLSDDAWNEIKKITIIDLRPYKDSLGTFIGAVRRSIDRHLSAEDCHAVLHAGLKVTKLTDLMGGAERPSKKASSRSRTARPQVVSNVTTPGKGSSPEVVMNPFQKLVHDIQAFVPGGIDAARAGRFSHCVQDIFSPEVVGQVVIPALRSDGMYNLLVALFLYKGQIDRETLLFLVDVRGAQANIERLNREIAALEQKITAYQLQVQQRDYKAEQAHQQNKMLHGQKQRELDLLRNHEFPLFVDPEARREVLDEIKKEIAGKRAALAAIQNPSEAEIRKSVDEVKQLELEMDRIEKLGAMALAYRKAISESADIPRMLVRFLPHIPLLLQGGQEASRALRTLLVDISSHVERLLVTATPLIPNLRKEKIKARMGMADSPVDVVDIVLKGFTTVAHALKTAFTGNTQDLHYFVSTCIDVVMKMHVLKGEENANKERRRELQDKIDEVTAGKEYANDELTRERSKWERALSEDDQKRCEDTVADAERFERDELPGIQADLKVLEDKRRSLPAALFDMVIEVAHSFTPEHAASFAGFLRDLLGPMSHYAVGVLQDERNSILLLQRLNLFPRGVHSLSDLDIWAEQQIKAIKARGKDQAAVEQNRAEQTQKIRADQERYRFLVELVPHAARVLDRVGVDLIQLIPHLLLLVANPQAGGAVESKGIVLRVLRAINEGLDPRMIETAVDLFVPEETPEDREEKAHLQSGLPLLRPVIGHLMDAVDRGVPPRVVQLFGMAVQAITGAILHAPSKEEGMKKAVSVGIQAVNDMESGVLTSADIQFLTEKFDLYMQRQRSSRESGHRGNGIELLLEELSSVDAERMGRIGTFVSGVLPVTFLQSLLPILNLQMVRMVENPETHQLVQQAVRLIDLILTAPQLVPLFAKIGGLTPRRQELIECLTQLSPTLVKEWVDGMITNSTQVMSLVTVLRSKTFIEQGLFATGLLTALNKLRKNEYPEQGTSDRIAALIAADITDDAKIRDLMEPVLEVMLKKMPTVSEHLIKILQLIVIPAMTHRTPVQKTQPSGVVSATSAAGASGWGGFGGMLRGASDMMGGLAAAPTRLASSAGK